jgi:hypothetical protein
MLEHASQGSVLAAVQFSTVLTQLRAVQHLFLCVHCARLTVRSRRL